MPKCDFKIAFRHGCSSVNLLHSLRTPFPNNITGRLLLLEDMIFSHDTVFKVLIKLVLI